MMDFYEKWSEWVVVDGDDDEEADENGNNTADENTNVAQGSSAQTTAKLSARQLAYMRKAFDAVVACRQRALTQS